MVTSAYGVRALGLFAIRSNSGKLQRSSGSRDGGRGGAFHLPDRVAETGPVDDWKAVEAMSRGTIIRDQAQVHRLRPDRTRPQKRDRLRLLAQN